MLAAVSFGVLIAVYALFVLTPAGQALGDQALIGNAELTHEAVRKASALLHHINLRMCIGLVAALLVISLFRRRWRTGVLATVGFALAVLTAEILKGVLPRPELDATLEEYLVDKTIDTYPSGHVTIMAAFVMALTLVAAPRLRSGITAVGGVVVAAVAVGVVVAGWHRPSDSIGGLMLACGALSLTALALERVGRLEESPRVGRSAFIITTATVTLLVGGLLAARSESPSLPEGVSPFVFPVMLIVVGAAALATVFAFDLATGTRSDTPSPRTSQRVPLG